MSTNTEQHIKTSVAAIGGLTVTVSDINTYIQIALGLASLVYVCLQIYWGFCKRRNGNEK